VTAASEEELWREQCRRQLQRHVMTRIKYGFCHVHKPVLDDVKIRGFATMKDYREWCIQKLPAYLGYKVVTRR
jgi:hypothetical protein